MTEFNGITFNIVNGSVKVDKSTIDQDGDAQLAVKVADELKKALEIGAVEDGDVVVVKNSSGDWDISSLDSSDSASAPTSTTATPETTVTRGTESPTTTSPAPAVDKSDRAKAEQQDIDDFAEAQQLYAEAEAKLESLKTEYKGYADVYDAALQAYTQFVDLKDGLITKKNEEEGRLSGYIGDYNQQKDAIKAKEDEKTGVMAQIENAQSKLDKVPEEAKRAIQSATINAMWSFDPSLYDSEDEMKDAWKKFLGDTVGPVAKGYESQIAGYVDDLSGLADTFKNLDATLKGMYSSLNDTAANIVTSQGLIDGYQGQIDALTTNINIQLQTMDDMEGKMSEVEGKMREPLSVMAEQGAKMTELSGKTMDNYMVYNEEYLGDGSGINETDKIGQNSTADGNIDAFERATFYIKNNFVLTEDKYVDGKLVARAGQIDKEAVKTWWEANQKAVSEYFGFEDMDSKKAQTCFDMMMWSIDHSRDNVLTADEMASAARTSNAEIREGENYRSDMAGFDAKIYNEAVRSGAVAGPMLSEDEKEGFQLPGYITSVARDVNDFGGMAGYFDDHVLSSDEAASLLKNMGGDIVFNVEDAVEYDSDPLINFAIGHGDFADDGKVDSEEFEAIIKETCMSINIRLSGSEGDKSNSNISGYDKIIELAEKEGYLTDKDSRLDSAELHQLVKKYGIEIIKDGDGYKFQQTKGIK